MSNHVIEVGSAIIQRDGKYLIAQRLAGSYLGPLWEFPGGKREADETLEECVVREVKEKLDIELKIDKQYRMVELNYPERTVRLFFFLCSIEGGKPRSIGCQHFRWIPPLEFDNYEFPPAD